MLGQLCLLPFCISMMKAQPGCQPKSTRGGRFSNIRFPPHQWQLTVLQSSLKKQHGGGGKSHLVLQADILLSYCQITTNVGFANWQQDRLADASCCIFPSSENQPQACRDWQLLKFWPLLAWWHRLAHYYTQGNGRCQLQDIRGRSCRFMKPSLDKPPLSNHESTKLSP